MVTPPSPLPTLLLLPHPMWQGVLGFCPCTSFIRIRSLGDFMHFHGFKCHLYIDDSQSYLQFRPFQTRISQLPARLTRSVLYSSLPYNISRTELLIFSTPPLTIPSTAFHISVRGTPAFRPPVFSQSHRASRPLEKQISQFCPHPSTNGPLVQPPFSFMWLTAIV